MQCLTRVAEYDMIFLLQKHDMIYPYLEEKSQASGKTKEEVCLSSASLLLRSLFPESQPQEAQVTPRELH